MPFKLLYLLNNVTFLKFVLSKLFNRVIYLWCSIIIVVTVYDLFLSYCGSCEFHNIYCTVLCRSSKTKRVTRVEHNKRAKRKEMLKEEAEAKKAGELSKQIDG